MARSLMLFLQVLVSDTPPHHPTTHRVMASMRDRSRWRKPQALEGVFSKPWLVWEHSHWEMAFPHQQWYYMGGASWQERQLSGCSCSSSVSYCFTDQVHQELWQGQASKDSVLTGDWWRSLFPFSEGWMANWHSYRNQRHWEKLGHPDRRGYITEEEQVPSQAKKLRYSNNITIF